MYRSSYGSRFVGGPSSGVQRAPSPAIGTLLQTLSISNIYNSEPRVDGLRPAEIRDCRCIASYNWLHRSDPTMVVPGCPPAWTPPVEIFKLERDDGDYYRDINAAHYPQYPLEPAVRAVLTQHPTLCTDSIDIFACSNTMGNLLRFVRRVDKQFRFFVEAVGNTVFFIRHENSPTELIPDVQGYGHSFPEANTSWDPALRESSSHQRLLKYSLDGLQCILRFGCDGYLEEKVGKDVSLPTNRRGYVTDDTFSSLHNLEMASQTANNQYRSLTVKNAGRQIPQSAVFDLKTRAVYRDNNVLNDALPHLWITQIPNLILARHQYGEFHDVQIMDVCQQVEDWQRHSQEGLRQLVSLIRVLIKIVKERNDRKLEVRCKDFGALEVREQDTDEHDVLPSPLRHLWLAGGRPSGKDSDQDWISYDADPLRSAEVFRRSKNGKGEHRASIEDDEVPADFTACSPECRYCGRCS